MIKAIKMAIKYKNTPSMIRLLPIAINFIEDIYTAVGDDGKMTKKNQSKLLKKFWAVVKEIKEKE